MESKLLVIVIAALLLVLTSIYFLLKLIQKKWNHRMLHKLNADHFSSNVFYIDQEIKLVNIAINNISYLLLITKTHSILLDKKSSLKDNIEEDLSCLKAGT